MSMLAFGITFCVTILFGYFYVKIISRCEERYHKEQERKGVKRKY